MKKRIVFIVAAVFLIGSLSRPNPPVRQRVVCRITVSSQGQLKTFTSQGKMQQILNAMRYPAQYTRADIDPDTLSAVSYQIILERTDGSSVTYRTKGERYIRRNQEPWKQTNPQVLTELTTLLRELPTDE